MDVKLSLINLYLACRLVRGEGAQGCFLWLRALVFGGMSMSESDFDSVAILVAVANADFAAALVQVLRNCAPFPVKAAVTNSLQQGLVYLDTNDVDIVLLEAFLPDCRGNAAVTKLRQKSNVPTIVFARKLTSEVEEQMKNFGANAVLSRDKLDPVSLVTTMQTVLEQRTRTNPQRKHSSRGHGGKSDREPTALTSSAYALESKDILVGVSRLQEMLSGQKAPAMPQKRLLRKLLGKSMDDLHTER